MYRFLLRKIRIYPVVSSVIVSLLGFVAAVESGLLLLPAPTTHHAGAHVENWAARENARRAREYAGLERRFVESTREAMAGLDGELAGLLADGEFTRSREKLLGLAAAAVSANDKQRLGVVLSLLGQVAILEQDLWSARVYLAEARDVLETLGDEVGVARINLQFGRVHLMSRQIARAAGAAYDTLQVGRWHLANGLPGVAEEYIHEAIRGNLSINRYGSAASAWESLAKLYLQQGRRAESREAIRQSALLFASSGREERAEAVLALLPDGARDDPLRREIRRGIIANNAAYRDAILGIERARDYRRLYNHYRNRGEQVRAWKFRLLADESLSRVDRRALFHRQQGVLAILYDSNRDMDRAGDYFRRARATFESAGLQQLSETTRSLDRQIY